jgi:hypothetical protein
VKPVYVGEHISAAETATYTLVYFPESHLFQIEVTNKSRPLTISFDGLVCSREKSNHTLMSMASKIWRAIPLEVRMRWINSLPLSVFTMDGRVPL